jgi:hypothetical protein
MIKVVSPSDLQRSTLIGSPIPHASRGTIETKTRIRRKEKPTRRSPSPTTKKLTTSRPPRSRRQQQQQPLKRHGSGLRKDDVHSPPTQRLSRVPSHFPQHSNGDDVSSDDEDMMDLNVDELLKLRKVCLSLMIICASLFCTKTIEIVIDDEWSFS